MTSVDFVDPLLRGMILGLALANLVGLACSVGPTVLRAAGGAFWLGLGLFVVVEAPDAATRLGLAIIPLYVFQLGTLGYLWLFFRSLFEDSTPQPRDYAPAIILIGTGLLARITDENWRAGLWLLHYGLQIILLVHLLIVVTQTWRGDLIEARRALRAPFATAVALAALAIVTGRFFDTLAGRGAGSNLIFTAIIAVLALLGAVVFLRVPNNLLERSPPRPVGAFDPITAKELAGLMAVAQTEKFWQREGLTIADLAMAIGLPEHRVRVLINQRLGYRNFASFINERRINAAKLALEDENQARKTIAEIAFSLGFGSLGPFNRAFKAATGVTPTEYRRMALEGRDR